MGDLQREQYVVQPMPVKRKKVPLWLWVCAGLAVLILIAVAADQSSPSSADDVMQSCKSQHVIEYEQQKCEQDGLYKLLDKTQ